MKQRRRSYHSRPLHPTGKLLKKLRKASGFTQKEIQEKLGFQTSSSISKIESRDFIPQAETLNQLLGLLQPGPEQRADILRYFNYQESDLQHRPGRTLPIKPTSAFEQFLLQNSQHLIQNDASTRFWQSVSHPPQAVSAELADYPHVISLAFQAYQQACLSAIQADLSPQQSPHNILMQFEIPAQLLRSFQASKQSERQIQSHFLAHIQLLSHFFSDGPSEIIPDFDALDLSALEARAQEILYCFHLELRLCSEVRQLQELNAFQMPRDKEVQLNSLQRALKDRRAEYRRHLQQARQLLKALEHTPPGFFSRTVLLQCHLIRLHALLGELDQASESLSILRSQFLQAQQLQHGYWLELDILSCREIFQANTRREEWQKPLKICAEHWPTLKAQHRNTLLAQSFDLPCRALFLPDFLQTSAQLQTDITSAIQALWYNKAQNETR